MKEEQGPEERFSLGEIEFEWYPPKADANLKKHGVSFREAATVLGDEKLLLVPDTEHSHDEERHLAIGRSDRGRLITMSLTDRGDRIRIISARVSERWERRVYEAGNEQ